VRKERTSLRRPPARKASFEFSWNPQGVFGSQIFDVL
jgi:hypothetical protein